MTPKKEYASIIDCDPSEMNLSDEIRASLGVIEKIRARPAICYIANAVNPNVKGSTGIENIDDLPFSEMVDAVPAEAKAVDVILVTPGGSAEQVAKFVDKLRLRFHNVGFILPNIAMSAGTIFCLSGDELVMDERAYIGPIDPQVPNREGRFVPAQSLLTLISDIQVRGDAQLRSGGSPCWTDVQILRNIDPKEIGNAINASRYSIELVTAYLSNYKFRDWQTHKNGSPVTDAERLTRANEIASQLCNHDLWKTHGRGITRDTASDICKLRITRPEDTSNLNDAIRKFWALVYYTLEKTNILKIFISQTYSIFRVDIPNQGALR
jgi:hypothetical protein